MKLKQKIAIAVLGLALPALVVMPAYAQEASQEPNLVFYYGQGCPHCTTVKAWFEQENIYERYPQLEVKEIYFNRANVAEFNDQMQRLGISQNERGVPALVVGDTLLVGDSPIIQQFEPVVNEYLTQFPAQIQPVDESSEEINAVSENASEEEQVSLWLLISAALVDAINPCAFAVLIILLSTVLAQKGKKRRIVASGLAFTIAIFISYLLMGLGVHRALATVDTTNWLTNVVGVLAIVLGLFNLKDWLWYGKTPPMEVPMSWRPKMKAVIQKVTSPPGAFIAGLIVSLFLLPCTSGPYIVVLGLLADNPLDARLLSYLVVYNLVFVLPMLIITWMVAQGTRVGRLNELREQHIDKLHLIAGIILIALGLVVLL